MELKNRKSEFPQMPLDMKKMVEREVEKQLQKEAVVPMRKRKWSKERVAVAALVAAMACGTSVFAAVGYYQMRTEQIGTYGVETGIEAAESETDTSEEIITEIKPVVLDVAYIPEGMVQYEEQKYCYEETPFKGGLSFVFYAMDMGDDAFRMTDSGVTHQEKIQAGAQEGIYLEFASEEGEGTKKLYVFYPDVHYVMELFVGADVSKEEAIAFASGIGLRPATEEDKEIVDDYVWSEYLADMKEDEQSEVVVNNCISKDEMEDTHSIGESFEVDTLTASVSEVAVYNDISVLNPDYVRDNLYDMGVVDADGNILPAKKEYYKSGDGINSLDTLVKTEEAARKLVYVTIDYTNNGTEELTDVLYQASLLKIVESGDEMRIWEWETETGADWDKVLIRDGRYFNQNMYYYDVIGGERNNNYISSIKPGETVTVHVGFIVTEEELPLMYLNLDSQGGCLEFSESALETGYVDIRQ